MTAVRFYSSNASLNLINNGTIIGQINPDHPGAVINLTNNGYINRSGAGYLISGRGLVNIINNNSIYAHSIKAGTLTNNSGFITTTNAIDRF